MDENTEFPLGPKVESRVFINVSRNDSDFGEFWSHEQVIGKG